MGFLSSVGGILNDLTGATSASNAAYSQNRQLASLSFQHQKEFAKNAHQWEMEDLKKAGLNPALTTGASSAGSIAGGGSTGGSASPVTGGGLSALSDIAGTINQTRQTNANVDQLDATAALQRAEAMRIIEMLPLDKKEKEKVIKNLGLTGENIKENTRFTKERSRGKTSSYSGGGWGFSGGYSKTE